jgi:predicted nucleic acid-binding protein
VRTSRRLRRTGIATVSCLPLLKDATAIARVTSGAPLVTADERLANALAARFPVRWLGALAV